eukprot:15435445-Alexandrium_andersonii.AAC.1
MSRLHRCRHIVWRSLALCRGLSCGRLPAGRSAILRLHGRRTRPSAAVFFADHVVLSSPREFGTH